MTEEDLTKKVLAEVAKDLSKIFDESIKTGGKITRDEIKKDLISAGNELQKDDKIADKSKDVLTLLGVKLPFEEKEGPKEETKKEESSGPKKEKKASATGQILAMVCRDFKISNEKIRAGLDKMELQCSDSTISMQANDTRKAIACLQKLGKLS